MPPGPIFVLPSPTQLRAGAIWVEVVNWTRACRSRYGDAVVLTPDGPVDAGDAARVAWGAGRQAQRSGSTAGRARVLAETAAKDFRWAVRGRRFARSVDAADHDAATVPFVWQHHDPFQTAGLDLARTLAVPSVLFVDAPHVWESTRWGVRRPGWGRVVERFGEQPAMRRADLVCCVSDDVAAEVARFGVPSERLLVTPCTAEPEDYADQPDVRAELGLGPGPVVGWIGSFRPFHHLELLVDAVAAAGAAGSDVQLLLVGDGPTREATLARAHDADVTVVAPGAVDHAATPPLLATMDIAVIPATADDAFHYSPLKLKEFMAAGCAVVAPRIGEMARRLRSGHDAVLYTPGDLGDLTAAVVELAASPAERARIGANAIDTVTHHFTMSSQLEAVEHHLGIS